MGPTAPTATPARRRGLFSACCLPPLGASAAGQGRSCAFTLTTLKPTHVQPWCCGVLPALWWPGSQDCATCLLPTIGPMQNPDDCGKQGKACCIVSTPSSERGRAARPAHVACLQGCRGTNLLPVLVSMMLNPREARSQKHPWLSIPPLPAATTVWCRQAGLYCPFKEGSFPGTCLACPSPVPEELQVTAALGSWGGAGAAGGRAGMFPVLCLMTCKRAVRPTAPSNSQWQCSHPLAEDFSMPGAN